MDLDIVKDISGTTGIAYTTYTTDLSGRLVQIEKDVSGAFVQRDMSDAHIDIPGLCINGEKESAKVLSSNSWPVAEESVKQSMQSIIESLLEPPVKIQETLPPILAVEISKPAKKSKCSIM